MKERWLIDVYRVDIPDDTVDDISEATEDACNRNRDYYVQVQGYSLKEVAERLMRSHEFEEMRKSNDPAQQPAPKKTP